MSVFPLYARKSCYNVLINAIGCYGLQVSLSVVLSGVGIPVLMLQFSLNEVKALRSLRLLPHCWRNQKRIRRSWLMAKHHIHRCTSYFTLPSRFGTADEYLDFG